MVLFSFCTFKAWSSKFLLFIFNHNYLSHFLINLSYQDSFVNLWLCRIQNCPTFWKLLEKCRNYNWLKIATPFKLISIIGKNGYAEILFPQIISSFVYFFNCVCQIINKYGIQNIFGKNYTPVNPILIIKQFSISFKMNDF